MVLLLWMRSKQRPRTLSHQQTLQVLASEALLTNQIVGKKLLPTSAKPPSERQGAEGRLRAAFGIQRRELEPLAFACLQALHPEPHRH
jgi:hypothetical protein